MGESIFNSWKTPSRFVMFILVLGATSFCVKVDNGKIDNDITVIENKDWRVAIKPEGAELQSIRNKNSDREYLWQGDPKFWEDRSPVMFPVNVRFKDNAYTHKGLSYEMPRMGLAIHRPFEVLKAGHVAEATFQLKADKETLKYYPFRFRLAITYRLEDNRLINHFEIENLGQDTLFFALGGHPGFRFPYGPKYERADYEYTFSDTMQVSRTVIAESLVQKSVLPFLDNESRLGLDDARVPENGSGMFLKNLQARRVGLALRGRQPFVEIELEDFPNVNLWTPPGSPYACIEPMVAHHDLVDSPEAIEDKSFLELLSPREVVAYRYVIILGEIE